MRTLLMVVVMLGVAGVARADVEEKATYAGHPLVVRASSLSKKNPTYSLKGALDANPRSVWAEGVDGSGVGEWLELQFPEPTEIQAVELVGGNEGNAKLYKTDNRIKSAHLTFSPESAPRNLSVRDDARVTSLLEILPAGMKLSSLRLTIDAIYKGSVDDTVISRLWPTVLDHDGYAGPGLGGTILDFVRSPPGELMQHIASDWTLDVNSKAKDCKPGARKKDRARSATPEQLAMLAYVQQRLQGATEASWAQSDKPDVVFTPSESGDALVMHFAPAGSGRFKITGISGQLAACPP